jgi:O-antigen ligase
MLARAVRVPRPYARETVLAAAATIVTLLLGLLSTHKWGVAGLLVPLGLVVLVILMLRPVVMVTLVVALTILCERATFGLFTFTFSFYGSIVKDVTILDGLVGLAVLAVAFDLIRHRRALYVPGPLRLSLLILALAMVAGAVTGHAAGATLHLAIFSEDTLAYLLLLPLAVANLDIDRHQIRRLLVGGMAIAIIKAVLGLVEITSGHSVAIEGIGRLTYFEGTANWVIMIALFGVFAAVVTRVRPPLWMLLGSPLLFASLLLSYRRSFWIAAVLGLALIVVIGLTPARRRLLVPVGLAMIAAIWTLSSVPFQSQSPIVERATSLAPSKLDANLEDRYRLDERANVLGEIYAHPITGLGVTIPWQATVQPLSVEHEGGREYVHFAALWFWLKLGILGLVAYVAILTSTAVLAWQTWRRNNDPLLRIFGLASLCGTASIAVIDTTGSFTGVDPRFSVVFAAQIGLLALAAKAGEGSLPSRS